MPEEICYKECHKLFEKTFEIEAAEKARELERKRELEEFDKRTRELGEQHKDDPIILVKPESLEKQILKQARKGRNETSVTVVAWVRNGMIALDTLKYSHLTSTELDWIFDYHWSEEDYRYYSFLDPLETDREKLIRRKKLTSADNAKKVWVKYHSLRLPVEEHILRGMDAITRDKVEKVKLERNTFKPYFIGLSQTWSPKA